MVTYPPVHKDIDPDLHVFKSGPDVLPVELVGLSDLDAALIFGFRVALVLQPEDNKGSFFLSQESRRLGEVMEEKERSDSDDNLILDNS
jgi:hypothetical protein